MIKKNKILAIIPARGGSKGIPRKNIKLLAGKPLIAYTIELALRSKYLDRVIVSTDSKQIAKISQKYGAGIIKRPKKIARDTSSTIDAIKHSLEVLTKEKNYYPALIVLLQPTSPLRTVKTIDSAIRTFSQKFDNYDSLISLSPVEGKIGKIVKECFMPNYSLGSRRQGVKRMYKECGTVYVFKPSLVRKGEMFGKRILPFIIKNYKESVDIDTIDDLKQVEYFMKN